MPQRKKFLLKVFLQCSWNIFVLKFSYFIHFEDVAKIFEECFIFTMKSIGIEMLELTKHSKMTLDYLINSIKVKNESKFLKPTVKIKF